MHTIPIQRYARRRLKNQRRGKQNANKMTMNVYFLAHCLNSVNIIMYMHVTIQQVFVLCGD